MLHVCPSASEGGISNLRLRFSGVSNLRLFLKQGHQCPLDTFIVYALISSLVYRIITFLFFSKRKQYSSSGREIL